MLAPWIISHFPKHHIYVEPFGGAASVLLRKTRSYGEVYNELDGEIVNVFHQVRDNGENLKEALRLTPFSRDEFDQSYLPSTDPLEQARRTIIRSFMGFGATAVMGGATGFRSNCRRSGTTPAHDWMNYPDCLDMLIDRLRGVVIESRDALKCMSTHDGDTTLHYVDPPYVHSERNRSHKYRYEMDDDQHRELATFLHGLEGMIVLSGYDSELYNDLYADWEKVRKNTYADGAQKRTEVLWINQAAQDAKSQLTFQW